MAAKVRKLTEEQLAMLTDYERHQYQSPRASSDLIAALETVAALRIDLARVRERQGEGETPLKLSAAAH